MTQIVNSPPIVTPDTLYSNFSNYLLLDIRTPIEYSSGHIAGTKNIQPDSLINYLNNIIINSYSKVVLIDNDGQSSAYYTCLLRLYGFENIYSLIFGMSQWNSVFASKWANSLEQSDLVADNVDDPYPHNDYNNLPEIEFNNNKISTEALAKNRIDIILKEGFYYGKQRVVLNYSLGDNIFTLDHELPSEYFIICYGIYELYNSNKSYPPTIALSNSFLYLPGVSLLSTTKLQTLPTTKKIVVYSVSGINSSFAVAYLRVMGYDAKSMDKGACTFTYNNLLLQKDKLAPFLFLLEDIRNYPFDTGSNL
ncbi:MAG TPA: rhodanese-like domain-containing protein [Ignavibacteriaceae bacterium]|nr:rhodanese-like domain-containing protein [Ignavibacteriaceae bacterium]